LPMLKQCTQALSRFTELAKVTLDNISPGKTEEACDHGH